MGLRAKFRVVLQKCPLVLRFAFVILIISALILQTNTTVIGRIVAAVLQASRSQTVPPLEQNQPLSTQVAADAYSASRSPILSAATKENKPRAAYEDKTKRTENSETIVQPDGKITKRISLAEPMHHKKNGAWDDLKPAATKVDSSVTLSVGDIKMTAKPLKQGIDYEYKGKKFSVAVEGANNSLPRVSKQNDNQTLVYEDAFSGVDITYTISGYSIKEAIVIKSKVTPVSFNFTYKDVTLAEHKQISGAVAIQGLPDNELYLAPLNVSTNKSLVTQPVINQNVRPDSVRINLDTAWLQALSAEAFPVVIDPTLKTLSKTAQDMQAIRSDGYRCGSGVCSPQAGNEEYPDYWAYWRTLLKIPFNEVQNENVAPQVSSARLHFVRNGGVGGSAGFTINPAGCWDFNCAVDDPMFGTTSYADIVDDTWMDVTSTINYMYMYGMTNEPLILREVGEGLSQRSIKTFDLSRLVLEVSYYADQQPPQPQLVSPVDKKVLSELQPVLTVNPVTDPDGDPVRYVFFLMSSPNTVISQVVTSDPFWTVPDGLLKDGTTYYWSANAVYGQSPQVGPIQSFKIDLRRGKDSTQTYDTAGPVSIDQATGNVTTSVSSHSLKALGGDMGVSLDYNTPAISRSGLVAEYWDNQTLTGNPKLTTITPNVDFNWNLDSPLPYEMNPSRDGFSARYSGFISVPQSGSYTFGAERDDGVRIYVNNTLVLDAWNSVATSYGTAVTLTSGVPVSIKIEYQEISNTAKIRLLAKTPSVPSGQIADKSWFNTGVKQYGESGLGADYYRASDSNGTFPSSLLTSGVETSFNYSANEGLAAKVPGGTVAPDLVRYRGLLKVPTTGTYTMSVDHQGGLRVRVNGRQIVSNWDKNALHSDSTAITLSAGTDVPIEMEYWAPVLTPASIKLFISGPSLPSQIIPAEWLTKQQASLPTGWQLGVDGNGSGFDSLRVNGSSVTLSDSTGSTHEYKWENNAYAPPVNEHGVLARGLNGTFTFKDDDGKIYVFAADGSLTSMVAPTDDRKPSGLQYVYAGSPSRLTRIVDSINNARFAELLYAGVNAGTNCAAPTGFDAVPTGYLCKIKTTDGVETNLRYKAGNLARVEGSGNTMTDFGYDTLKRITNMRDPLANDAIAAGIRSTTDGSTYDISYDNLGRAKKVVYPAATVGASRAGSNYVYLPGATLFKKDGASEPSGYSQRIEYDESYRTVKVFGHDGKATQTQWDVAKDLVLSTTDPLGLKTTTLYDSNDRPAIKYGPAPASWFGSDNQPLSTQVTNVPKTESRYDESMQGLSASFYDNKYLAREPKARTFERGDLIRQWTSSNRPVTPTSDGWGLRLSGEIILPDAAAYTVKLSSDDGGRVYIDNRLYVDDWTDGAFRDHPAATYTSDKAGKRVQFRIDYYDKDSSDTNSKLELRIYKPGATESEAILTRNYLVPSFSLTTSETVTDSTLGAVTNTRTYNRPEYGVLDKITLDPTGLNYASTTVTEAPGVGVFRQTEKTLPGGNKTTYQHYTSADLRDNPCTTATESARQAGMPKGKTEPDPDGSSGPLIGQKSEMIYDDSGQVVAARINSENYTCTTYDARGRVTKVVTPASGNRTGMTSETNYAVDGNPLKIATTDSNGTVTTEIDLLGRTIKYTDAFGNTTAPTYDSQGRITAKTSTHLGTEKFTYDNLDRLTAYSISDIPMASIYYDQYSRITNIDYPASNLKLASLEYDTLLRIKAVNWKLSDGTNVREEQTKSTTGLITTNKRTIGTDVLNQNFTYDKAGRLRTANVGTHTMAYNFDWVSTCGAYANANANKNANRSSQTIDGVNTTYCYDYADRLISSSDANYNNPVYDDRGNITQIGSTSKPIKFSYDQSNRAIKIEQRDASGNGTIAEFRRDAGGRILVRKQSKLTNNVTSLVSEMRYGYSTPSDSPDIITDTSNNLLRKVYSLPGGITMTSSPTESLQAKQRTYTIPNFHGDTMLTTDYSGIKTGAFTYDPFGNQLDGTAPPQGNSTPGTSKGYLAQFDRLSEVDFSVPIINMGDRLYLPGLGRFMQADPVEGGNANAYIYPADPVNSRDTDGNFAFLIPIAIFVAKAIVTAVVFYAISKIIQKVVPPPYRAPVEAAVNIASFATPSGAARKAASKAPVYVPKVIKSVKNVFGGSTYVYKGIKNGKEVYTGIAKNPVSRAAQHGDRFDYLEVLNKGEPLSRIQARSIEEALIVRNPDYQNKIHSISPKNVNYKGYLEWGNKWLDNNGIQ